MGRPSKWSGKTTAIRIPENLADHLLEIAQQLDGFVQKTEAPEVMTFGGPYLVTVNETPYLVDPPKALIGDEAKAVKGALEDFENAIANLKPSEKALMLARLTEAWCKPLNS